MVMARVITCAAATLALCCSLCAAAPKVDIRIVPRPRPEPVVSMTTGPIPFRDPATPSGPFSSYLDQGGCIKNQAIEVDGESFLVDFCHSKNVTFMPPPPPVEAVSQTTEGPSSSEGTEQAGVSAELPTRKLMGIFRGWKIDPIHKKFKYATFDDGDLCGEYGERYSVTVELVPSTQPDSEPRLYDLRKHSPCAFALRAEMFVPEYELIASNGIHTAGVLDISDAYEVLPQICGEMKCQYSHVSAKVGVVKDEINSVKMMMEGLAALDGTSVTQLSLSSASSIIKASTDIMEKALELLDTIELLEKDAYRARERAAAALAAATQSKDTEATSPDVAVAEQTEVVATS